MRRPKSVTEERAREQARLSDRMAGEVEQYREEAATVSRESEGGVGAIGNIENTRGAIPAEMPEPERRNSGRSFFFADNPLARDRGKREAVGG